MIEPPQPGPKQGQGATYSFTRRTILSAGAAALASPVLPATSTPSARIAVPAAAFSQSIGICTHPCWRQAVWGSADWVNAFLETGAKATRGEVGHGGSAKGALSDLKRLFAQGVKICALIPGRSLDREAAAKDVRFLADEVGARNLCGIESVNEYNNPKYRPAHWAKELREFQKWLHDEVRSHSALDDVPLVAPSLWNNVEQDAEELGSLGNLVDRGCLHYYTGGRPPSQAARYGTLDSIRRAHVVAPGKPIFVTEFGYDIATHPEEQSPWRIEEAAAAKYMLRGLFELFGAGVKRTFLYSLIDDERGPGHYGLLDGKLRPRSTFRAIVNLSSLFRDLEAAFRPARLEVQLLGEGGDLRSQLFQKSNGVFLLVLYRNVENYNRESRRSVQVPARPIRITLPTALPMIRTFDPLLGATPVKTAKNTDTFNILLADGVSILEIHS